MLKTRLAARNKGATVEAPYKPTEGSGPRATLYPFLSVEYVGSCVGQLDKAALTDPKSCLNIGDHLMVMFQIIRLSTRLAKSITTQHYEGSLN
ncbi:MAG: hypothetical protein WBE11_07430 [Candidatus Aminicenantaceae bacterium]